MTKNKTTNKSLRSEKTVKKQKKRRWSKKYKNSINCTDPRGFSQKQHCLSKLKKKVRNKKKMTVKRN
jgi:hypothetical protein